MDDGHLPPALDKELGQFAALDGPPDDDHPFADGHPEFRQPL